MGRPSKHRLQNQTTASLRQREMKLLNFAEQLADDVDENGWHARTVSPPTVAYLASSMSPTGMSADIPMTRDDMLMMRDDGEMMSVDRQRRSRSFGSDGARTDGDLQRDKSDCDSNLAEVSSHRPRHDHVRNIDYYIGTTMPVSIKTECADIVGLSPSPSSLLAVAAADRMLSAGWRGGKQQHVLSGGYCCEVNSGNAATAGTQTVPFVSDPFGRSPQYVVKTRISSAAETTSGDKCDPMLVDEAADCTATSVGIAPLTCSTRATVESPDDGVSAAGTAEQLSRATTDVSPAADVSPGSKWHIASDRDSPYVSVMALASSCHLFSESCPSKSASVDDSSFMYDPASSRYWLHVCYIQPNHLFCMIAINSVLNQS